MKLNRSPKNHYFSPTPARPSILSNILSQSSQVLCVTNHCSLAQYSWLILTAKRAAQPVKSFPCTQMSILSQAGTLFGPKDLDFCFFDKCLGGVAQSTSGLLRRVTPALLRSLLVTKKPADVLPYSVCVAEDPANRAREEKKRFRSRQTASKQGTNHSDSYSRRIDLPRSNAVAREARTFAYVPFFFPGHLLQCVEGIRPWSLR